MAVWTTPKTDFTANDSPTVSYFNDQVGNNLVYLKDEADKRVREFTISGSMKYYAGQFLRTNAGTYYPQTAHVFGPFGVAGTLQAIKGTWSITQQRVSGTTVNGDGQVYIYYKTSTTAENPAADSGDTIFLNSVTSYGYSEALTESILMGASDVVYMSSGVRNTTAGQLDVYAESGWGYVLRFTPS